MIFAPKSSYFLLCASLFAVEIRKNNNLFLFVKIYKQNHTPPLYKGG